MQGRSLHSSICIKFFKLVENSFALDSGFYEKKKKKLENIRMRRLKLIIEIHSGRE